MGRFQGRFAGGCAFYVLEKNHKLFRLAEGGQSRYVDSVSEVPKPGETTFLLGGPQLCHETKVWVEGRDEVSQERGSLGVDQRPAEVSQELRALLNC